MARKGQRTGTAGASPTPVSVSYPELVATIAACIRCPLAETRTNTVPVDNEKHVAVAMVGEAPGRNEDLQGRPFVGRSGDLLNRAIEHAGHTRAEVAVLNTICCRPPNNRDPNPDELKACLPNYVAQLDYTGAWIVVLLGNAALSQVIEGAKISEHRGKPFWSKGRIYIPTYHPAYVLRNRKAEALLRKDIGLAFEIFRGEKWWQPVVKTFTNRLVSAEVVTQLDKKGWALAYSPRIQDMILVLVDENVTRIPTKHKHLTRYTIEELVRIGELGKGRPISDGDLARLHLVKSIGGTIVQ